MKNCPKCRNVLIFANMIELGNGDHIVILYCDNCNIVYRRKVKDMIDLDSYESMDLEE